MWLCPLANGCVASPVIVKNRKCFADLNVLVIFGVNLPQRGIYPQPIFTKFGMREGLSGSHPQAKFYRFGLVNMGLRPKKLPKMVIFGTNFPQRGI